MNSPEQRPTLNWEELEQVGIASHLDLVSAFRQLLSPDIAIQSEADTHLGDVLLRHPDVIPAVVKSLIGVLHDADAASSYATTLRLLLYVVQQAPMIPGIAYSAAESILPVLEGQFLQSTSRYLALLDSKEPQVRGLAASALASTNDPKFASAIVRKLEIESDTDATLSMLSALAVLKDPESLPAVARQLTAIDSMIQIRAAATFCLLATPNYFAALQMLIETATGESPSAYVAWSTLLDCGTDVLERAVQVWIQSLSSKSGHELRQYVHKLLRIMFPSQSGDSLLLNQEELSRPQLYLLRSFLVTDSIWEMPADDFQPNIYNDLLDSGLPATRDDLARFLGPIEED